MLKEKVKGLKYVHIGEEAWACGRIKSNYQNTRRKHMVIYAPDHKEYHIFDNDVDFITNLNEDKYHRRVFRDGNIAIESQLKIFILTSILDKKENWHFDLTDIPDRNKLKIIYNNGTVKIVDFNGIFESIIIPRKYVNKNGERVPFSTKTIYPIAYRLYNTQ